MQKGLGLYMFFMYKFAVWIIKWLLLIISPLNRHFERSIPYFKIIKMFHDHTYIMQCEMIQVIKLRILLTSLRHQ